VVVGIVVKAVPVVMVGMVDGQAVIEAVLAVVVVDIVDNSAVTEVVFAPVRARARVVIAHMRAPAHEMIGGKRNWVEVEVEVAVELEADGHMVKVGEQHAEPLEPPYMQEVHM
jgi:hypothetical protein